MKIQARKALHEVNFKTADGHNIPPDQDIVWTVKGGEYCAYDINIERAGEGETGPNVRDGYRTTTRLTGYRGSNRAEAERFCNLTANTGMAGADINEGVDELHPAADNREAVDANPPRSGDIAMSEPARQPMDSSYYRNGTRYLMVVRGPGMEAMPPGDLVEIMIRPRIPRPALGHRVDTGEVFHIPGTSPQQIEAYQETIRGLLPPLATFCW